MSPLSIPTLWLKSPQAVFTANHLDAGNGLVIRGKHIIELVKSG
ncbi:MAG: 8-oxoguanine deaminase [Paraglaciecola sp.]|jgi:8-oxoguanine deaminase